MKFQVLSNYKMFHFFGTFKQLMIDYSDHSISNYNNVPAKSGFVYSNCFDKLLMIHNAKTLTFKLIESQPEPVEGGFDYTDQLRQAQLDTVTVANFCNLQRA